MIILMNLLKINIINFEFKYKLFLKKITHH